MGKELNKTQIEDTIALRCKSWFDMTVDNNWMDVIERADNVAAYIQFFKGLNNELVKPWDRIIWIKLETILCDLEVAIDAQDEEGGECWETYLQVFESLWHHIEGRLV